jgi:hypothetical protein
MIKCWRINSSQLWHEFKGNRLENCVTLMQSDDALRLPRNKTIWRSVTRTQRPSFLVRNDDPNIGANQNAAAPFRNSFRISRLGDLTCRYLSRARQLKQEAWWNQLPCLFIHGLSFFIMELTWKEDSDSAKKEFGLWHLPPTFDLYIKSREDHQWGECRQTLIREASVHPP